MYQIKNYRFDSAMQIDSVNLLKKIFLPLHRTVIAHLKIPAIKNPVKTHTDANGIVLLSD